MARSRGSGTIQGSVIPGAVDAITIVFLIVLMIVRKDRYVDIWKDRAVIVRPKGFEVRKNYKMILSRPATYILSPLEQGLIEYN